MHLQKIIAILLLGTLSFDTVSQENPEETTEETSMQDSGTEEPTELVEEETVTEEATTPEAAPPREPIVLGPVADETSSEQETSSTEQESAEEPQTETSAEEKSEAQESTETTASQEASDETAAETSSSPEGETSPAETETTTQEAAADEPTEEKPQPMVIPPIPELKEEEITIPSESTALPEKPVGIDTTAQENPQGNWLYKRIWWERAEERYEKIRLLVDEIWESRTKFFHARNELDRNVLDPFYIGIGIDQGELQGILSEINDFLEKKREKQGELNEQELLIYEAYTAEEESLKQLKIDVESVTTLDHAIDDALGTLMNQINRVRNYEAQAWDNFKEISHILNDTKARELYYMIEGAARNIKNIGTYVSKDFFPHFNNLISEATKHIKRIQEQFESLKEKGISFQRQTKLIEQAQQKATEERAEEEEDEKPAKPALGWIDWIGSLFFQAFDYIVSIIKLPYHMLFGK